MSSMRQYMTLIEYTEADALFEELENDIRNRKLDESWKGLFQKAAGMVDRIKPAELLTRLNRLRHTVAQSGNEMLVQRFGEMQNKIEPMIKSATGRAGRTGLIIGIAAVGLLSQLAGAGASESAGAQEMLDAIDSVLRAADDFNTKAGEILGDMGAVDAAQTASQAPLNTTVPEWAKAWQALSQSGSDAVRYSFMSEKNIESLIAHGITPDRVFGVAKNMSNPTAINNFVDAVAEHGWKADIVRAALSR